MAKWISNLVILAVFLLNYVQLGTSLKCYDCKSNFNQHCDHIDVKTTADQDCTHSRLVKAFPQVGNKYVCVIHKMEQKEEPNLSVIRGCAPDKYCDFYKNSIQCTTCDTDLCNSASAILPSIGLFVSFILLKHYI